MIRRPDIQGLHVPNAMPRPAVAQVIPGLASFRGSTQNDVIDIGEILHVPHRPARVLQVSDQRIGGGVGKHVPQMRRVVWGNAAHIHRHRLLPWLTGFNTMRQRVHRRNEMVPITSPYHPL
jgi:hypothetical protein